MLFGQDVAGFAAEEKAAAGFAAVGTELYEVVGLLHHVEAVFDEDEGVARVGHLVEEEEQAAHVVEVEAVGGLVDDVGVARRELCVAVGEVYGGAEEMVGQLDALQFAAAEGAHGLVEVEVAEADFLQHTQLGEEGLVGKESDGLFDGELHHLGDGLAMVAVLQCLVVVAAAVAFFADSLDAFHEGHVAHDDALPAAGGAGTEAVEREELHGGTF